MPADNNKYSLLVIEDNPGDFALVEDFLFEHITAPHIVNVVTFKAAEDVLADQTFDAVLLDLSLPDKTGEQLIKGILKISGQTPVIVLTGYADFSFGVKSVSMGISDYILKEELNATSLYKSIVYSIERKKSITALQQSEKRYSDLFSLSPLPMWVFDVNTLFFLDVNNSAVNHYGYTRSEFLAFTIKDIRPEDEIPKLEEQLAKNRLNPDARSYSIMTHKKKSGDLIDVDLQVAPIVYEGRKANMVIATDITERSKYTQAIEQQNEKLKEISWIQSHIVRAPLAKIMALIPLIRGGTNSTEELSAMLGYIADSANELDKIIREISDKSKIEDFEELIKNTRSIGKAP